MHLNNEQLDKIEKRRRHQNFLRAVRDMSLLIIVVSGLTFLAYAVHVANH